MKRNIIASDEIKVELTFPDLVAILAIDEVLAEHLESVEDKLDPGITPSDRVRGAIAVLTRDRHQPCPDCNGLGAKPGTLDQYQPPRCTTCNGEAYADK